MENNHNDVEKAKKVLNQHLSKIKPETLAEHEHYAKEVAHMSLPFHLKVHDISRENFSPMLERIRLLECFAIEKLGFNEAEALTIQQRMGEKAFNDKKTVVLAERVERETYEQRRQELCWELFLDKFELVVNSEVVDWQSKIQDKRKEEDGGTGFKMKAIDALKEYFNPFDDNRLDPIANETEFIKTIKDRFDGWTPKNPCGVFVDKEHRFEFWIQLKWKI